MRSIQTGPSRIMKNVMNVIVTTATIAVMIPFVIASAVPVRPRTEEAPPDSTASRTRSVTWYFDSRNPSGPSLFVTSSM